MTLLRIIEHEKQSRISGEIGDIVFSDFNRCAVIALFRTLIKYRPLTPKPELDVR